MRKTIIYITCIYIYACTNFLNAQVAINSGGTPPHASAMLDVSSTSKGVLIPRMTETQRQSISPLTEGLLVYQTSGDKGYYYYNGSSWTRLSTHSPMWTDEGDYLSPAGPIGTNIKIADASTYSPGFYSSVNTGANPGSGALFQHTNTSGNSYGIQVVSDFTGSDNTGLSTGAYIHSISTTQDQRGLMVSTSHTGTTGSTEGVRISTNVPSGYTGQIHGIYNSSERAGDENDNYGLVSRALHGSYAYGVDALAQDAEENYGLYGKALNGMYGYGVYGIALGSSWTYGVYGVADTWGGHFKNYTSNKEVYLGGLGSAIQILDGTQGTGKVLTSGAGGEGSWQSLPAALWIDHGDYLSPAGPIGGSFRIADDETYQYGIYTTMFAGANPGYGAYLVHENTDGDSYGIYASGSYNGTGNTGVTRGASFHSLSTTQDQNGIENTVVHTGATGTTMGINNQVTTVAGNPETLYGIYSSVIRGGNENSTNGIYSVATEGKNVTGVSGNANSGDTLNVGIRGNASDGYQAYGIYGSASSAISTWGVLGMATGAASIGVSGQGDSWGGIFFHNSNGNEVKLGGWNYAIQILDGNEAAGKVLTSNASGYGTWQSLPAYPSPGGSNGYVQFNNGGSFGGDGNFFWDNSNKRLGIGTTAPTSKLEVYGDIEISSFSYAYMINNYDVLRIPVNVNNISVGANAGSAVSSGQHNAFFGYNAGNANTTAWDNTFIGYQTGLLTTSGGNTCLGSNTGRYLTGGTYNTYLGYQAGYSNSTPDYTPEKNTFVGGVSGYSNSSGSYNTFVGYESGRNNSTGSNNVFLGYQAGYNESGNNKLYIHNNSSSSPLIYGEFDNSLLKINGRLGIQTPPNANAALHVDFNNLYAGYFTSDMGSSSTEVIHAEYDGAGVYDAIAVYGESTPSTNVDYGIGGMFLGNYYGVYANSNPGSSGGEAYGILSICEGTGGIRYGVYGIVDASSGSIYGVYGDAPVQTGAYGVYCAGNGAYTGTWSHVTEPRFRKNLNEITGALDIIKQLEPASYEYRTNEYKFIHLAEGRHYGFDTKQLGQVLPELVGSGKMPVNHNDKNPEMVEFQTENTIELIPILTQAIKEQQAIIENQQKLIEDLQVKMDALANTTD